MEITNEIKNEIVSKNRGKPKAVYRTFSNMKQGDQKLEQKL